MEYTINEDLARRANDSFSMSDYVAGSATAEYKSACEEVKELGERCKKGSYNPEKIDYLVDLFCKKYADWKNRFNSNTASCPSILITGGSNFPVRKKEKQNAREDTSWAEYNEIMAIKDRIKSVGTTIQSDNPQAIELLQQKLDGLKAAQTAMKETNAYYKKHKMLDGCTAISAEEIEEIKAQWARGWYTGVPFPSYSLTNNSANIKRTADRIVSLSQKAEQAAEAPQSETEIEGIKVIENAEIDRLQLIFGGKPSEEIRSELKSHGFHWSPRYGAWQRQLTENAKYEANRILGKKG